MNTPTNPAEHDLNTRLAHRADEFVRRGGTELDISQVLGRAGEIRRGRRMRATMVMAACVLAIAVPTVLVATRGGEPHSAPLPAKQVDESPLTLEGLDRGEAPGTGYLVDHTWRTPDGDVDLSGLDDPIREVAALKGWLLVATQDGGGNLWANLVDDHGGITGQARPMEGGFSVSADDSLAGFVRPDGTPVVVKRNEVFALPKIPRGSGFQIVDVTGDDCQQSGAHTCSVVVTSRGEKAESWVSTSTDFVDGHEWMSNIVDVYADRYLAGFTEVTDSGSCSIVKDVEHVEQGTPTWQTCDYSFESFSPDGGHLLATSAYRDGIGATRLAVLDSKTGTALLDLATPEGAFINKMVWEDESHVLATVFQGGRWGVLRIGLDGSREYAVPPIAGEDVETPFVLPMR